MVAESIAEEGAAARRREAWTLVAIMFIALVARVLVSILADRVIKWDEPDYIRLGVNLLTGRGFTTVGYPELHYTPLFPIVTAAMGLLVRNLEAGSEIVSAICGTLLLVPVYAVARRVYGRRVGMVAAALLAVFPALSTSVQYWGTMSEPLYILLIYSALLAVLRVVMGGPPRYYAASGALFALAYLARPEGITYAAVMLLLIALVKATERRLLDRDTLVGLLLFVLVFVLVTFPYMLYLHKHTGQWTVTGKLGVTYDIGAAVIADDPAEYDRVTASLDSEGKEIIWFSEERFERSLVEIVLSDPQAFLSRIVTNARTLRGRFFSRKSFPSYFMIPVFLGLFLDAWNRKRLKHEAFLALSALPVLSFLPFHIELRFFSPAYPVLLIWAAHGLVRLGHWAAETFTGLSGGRWIRWGVILRWAPVGLAVLYLLAMQPGTARDGLNATNFARREVGLWLRENVPQGAKVMARDLSIAVYAERELVPSPHADYDRYLEYARVRGADYLVADEWELTVLRPQLGALLDTGNPPEELELVHTHRDEQGVTIVYRIKD